MEAFTVHDVFKIARFTDAPVLKAVHILHCVSKISLLTDVYNSLFL